jgi:chaperone modulatory protein CbpM
MIGERDLLRMIDGLEAGILRRWVEEGWVRPHRRAPEFVFAEIDVARVRLIHELRVDLEIDDAAIPIVLSLIDQLYGLRRELRLLSRAVQEQPEEGRQAIAACIARSEERE